MLDNDTGIVKLEVQFMLISTGSLARNLRIELLNKGIQVRDYVSFGLTEYIRLRTQFDEENQRLLDELQLHFLKNEGDNEKLVNIGGFTDAIPRNSTHR